MIYLYASDPDRDDGMRVVVADCEIAPVKTLALFASPVDAVTYARGKAADEGRELLVLPSVERLLPKVSLVK